MKKLLTLFLGICCAVLSAASVEYPLVPMPKEIRIKGKVLLAPEQIIIAGSPGDLAAKVFNKSLKNHGLPGIAVKKAPGNAAAVIRFVSGVPAPAKEQGYAVSVRKNGNKTEIILAGHDKTGLLYAAVTFAQMFRSKNGKLEFPVAEIRDFPDVRGRYCASLNYWFRRRFLFRLDKGTEAAKRHIDWALEHKINVVSGELHHSIAQPETATPAVKAFFKEVNTYAALRGITVFYVTHTNVGTKKRDGKNPEFKDCINLRGLLYDWSNDKLLERRAAEIARFVKDCGYTGLMLHTMDTANSLWGERNAATRKRFGDDRFSADANVINIFYRAFRKVAPKGFFSAVPRPYFGNPENPAHIRRIGEMNSGDSYPRFVSQVPADVYICKREEAPEDHAAWMRVFRQPLFTYIEHNWGILRFSGAPLGANFRYIPGHFKAERNDWLFYEANWPQDYPAALAAVEFAWNLKTPGSRILKHPPYGSGKPHDRQAILEEYDAFGPDGKRNPELLPLIRRISDNLYAPYGKNFDTLLTSFIRSELIWDHRATLEMMERANLPTDIDSAAMWVGRIARDSQKALEALQQIPDTAPLFTRQSANSRIASLLSLAPAAAALEQGLKGEAALRTKDYKGARLAAEKMMQIYRKALEEFPARWQKLRKKPALFPLAANGGGALKKFGGELRLRELRIKSRVRMMTRNTKKAVSTASVKRSGIINIAFYAPEEGKFYGAKGLKEHLTSMGDFKVTVVNDLKKETLMKYDCLVFPDCKKFGKVIPDADILREYCIQQGKGIYFEHDSCGHQRFPFHMGLFPELGEIERSVGYQFRHRNYNAADRILINKRTGEKFHAIYSDHFAFKGVNPAHILGSDLKGSPVWVAGNVGKGRVVLNGGITFHYTDREVAPKEISVEERQLITDGIIFCSGKKGHELLPEALSSRLEIQTDAIRHVVRFKAKVLPAFALKSPKLSCVLRRNGKNLGTPRTISLNRTSEGTWESDTLTRMEFNPSKEAVTLYLTLTDSGKSSTRSFKIPLPKE